MAEISNQMKKLFVFDAIICFIYTLLYLVIPETFSKIVEYKYYDPVYWRHFGGTSLVIGIFCLVAIKRAEWEQIKVVLEIGIAWVISILAIAIWEFFVIPATAIGKANTLFVIILILVIIIINIYFYLREQK